MSLITEISWPGIQAFDSFHGEQSHGTSPGRFLITCYPQDKPPETKGTLTLSYSNGFKRTFEDCIIDSASWQFNESGEVVGITILDWRWRWRGGEISGRYNQRTQSGKINTDFYEAKTPRELAELCLKKMSQKGFDVSEIPVGDYPAIDWDADNPAAALQSLCESVGCRVVPQKNNRVKICRVGKGKELFPNLPYTGLGEALELFTPYDSIMVIGAPVVAAVTYKLQMVGLTNEFEKDSGQKRFWKPMDDLSYKPAGGWENDGLVGVIDVFENGGRNAAYFEQSVWKWLEPTTVEVAPGCKLLDEAGVKSPIKDYRAALPMLQEIPVSSFLDSEEFKFAAKMYQPIVNGKHLPQWDAVFRNVDQIVATPFSIEQSAEHLLVKFSTAVFSLDDEGKLAKPELSLGASANILDPNKKTPIRFTRSKKISSSAPGTDSCTLILRHDDIVLYHGTDKTLNKNCLDECNKRADYYIDLKIKELRDHKPQSQELAGWFDIELDGAIQVMEFEYSQGGTVMKLYRNQDHGTPISPSYVEKMGSIQQEKTSLKTANLFARAEASRRGVK
jgi:hypothetical protein